MKVLYIHPDTIQDSDSKYVIPIGMIGTSNIISGIVDDYWAIDVPLEKRLNNNYQIINDVILYNPDVILIDLHWYIYSYESIELSRNIKDKLPNCVIILGGITSSIFCEEIMDEYKFIDFIVRGDAELPLKLLINRLKDKNYIYSDIPNLSYRYEQKCIHNKKNWICESLEDIDYSNYDFLKNKDDFFKMQGMHRKTVISPKLAWIPIARGCNHNCSYCGGNCQMFESIFKRKNMLISSPEKIAETMQKLYDNYNIDIFGITHGIEIFGDEYCKKFCNAIKRLSFKPGIYDYLFQLPSLEVIKEFVKCVDDEKTIIGLPILTGNEELRRKNGKIFSNEDIFRFLDEFRDSKIKIEIYFIDNLLYDDGRNYIETKKFISQLYEKFYRRINMRISYGFEVIQPFSKKHTEAQNSLVSFEDFYYRFSYQFEKDVRKGKNLKYIIGESEYNSSSYKRLKDMEEYIEKEEKKDIVFVCLPSGKNNKFEKSIGVAYIEAYIKQFGYTSIQILPESIKVEEIVNKILGYDTKIIGFSCYDSNYYYIKLISQKIKRINPNVSIIVGGPTATFSSSIIMDDCKEIDFCQKGYGEISLVKLLDKFLKGIGNIGDIEGLVYRKDNTLCENKITRLPNNIDIFPSPYLSDINFFPDRKIVFTSRGCNHNCVYCNCATMCERKIFFHSEDRVLDELEYISNREPGAYVLIGDDAFTLNIERAKRICKKIIDKKINLKLFCETRADKLDDELLCLMKNAGFIKVDFGLESAVPKILRNVKKTFYREEDKVFNSEKHFLDAVKNAVQKTKELNMDPMVNIITGLPGEEKEDALETLEYIKSLKINSYSHNYLRIYSGTEIYYNHEKWKYKIHQNAFKLPFIIKYPYDVTTVTPLSNSVNRNTIVKLREDLKNVLLGNKKYFVFEKLSADEIEILKNIDLNEEIFVKVLNEEYDDKFSKFIVDNEIPTSNINYIIEREDNIRCFNSNDRENYIVVIKAVSDNFRLPQKYYEILYIDKMTQEILNKFREYNVNPYVNRFVVTKLQLNENDEYFWKEMINDYSNLYLREGKVQPIIKFLEYIKYDMKIVTPETFKELYSNKIFTVDEVKAVIKFLKYYLLGVIDNE